MRGGRLILPPPAGEGWGGGRWLSSLVVVALTTTLTACASFDPHNIISRHVPSGAVEAGTPATPAVRQAAIDAVWNTVNDHYYRADLNGVDWRAARVMSGALLEVTALRTWFPLGGRWLGTRDWIRAVDDVDLSIARGEVLGVVGESGSGKTTLGRSILRVVEPTSRSIRFGGREVLRLGRADLRALRRRMQIVF